MKKRLLAGFVTLMIAALPLVIAAEKQERQPTMSPAEAAGRSKRALDHACKYLFTQQQENGAYGDDDSSFQPAITALVVKAVSMSPRGYLEGDGPHISKAVEYIVSMQQPNGAITNSSYLQAYNTSIAIMALEAMQNPTYDPVIKKAVDFLKKMQKDEGEGLTKKDDYYGGWGYATSFDKADLSNTGMVVEALKEAGVPSSDPAFKKAMVFVKKCQKNTATNPIKKPWVSNNADGGLIYRPGQSKAGTERKYFFGLLGPVVKTKSYGLMTYKGLLSMAYADVGKKDPRVQAALKYVKNHYDFDNNVALEKDGLYYYRMTLAKAFKALDIATLQTAKGKKNWAYDLTWRLIEDQQPNGSWVNTESSKWEEDNPVIVTAFAIQSLAISSKQLKNWLKKQKKK